MTTRFFVVDPRENAQVELDFSDFIGLVQGSSISSGAASEESRSFGAGDHSDFLELGLTDAVNLRVQASPDGQLIVTLMSTLNADDIPPLRLQIIASDETPSAALVEQRIRALRQSYAIAYLVQTDRAGEAEALLIYDKDADLESLLGEPDRLYISAAGPGSLWLTIATKTASAYKTVKYAVALPYKEGRDALLRRVEADTRLAELSADEKQLAAPIHDDR